VLPQIVLRSHRRPEKIAIQIMQRCDHQRVAVAV
jgi:hypothetical protein